MSEKMDLRSWVAIRLMKITASMSLASVQRLGRALGWLLSAVPNRNRAVAELNISWCYPSLPLPEQKRLAKASLHELGKMVMEGGPSWLWAPERLTALLKNVEGAEAFFAARDRGKGVILVTPHIGNWELLPIWLTHHTDVCAMYKPPKMSALDRVVRESRARHGIELAPTGVGGVKTLLNNLRAGKTLIVLADHEPSGGAGVQVDFMGVSAFTGVLVPRLAAKTGAAVVLAAMIRLPDAQGYSLHISAGPELSGLEETLAAVQLNEAMERLIRRFPEQFMWNYKRFRTQAAGTPNPYRAALKK